MQIKSFLKGDYIDIIMRNSVLEERRAKAIGRAVIIGSILGIIIVFILAGILMSDQIKYEKLKKVLCSDAEAYGYPAWFVNNNGYINYAFVGYSATTASDIINGTMQYNDREATKKELTDRFIGNNIYFVYSNNDISNKQIDAFKKDGFWNKYQNSGMTFYCN